MAGAKRGCLFVVTLVVVLGAVVAGVGAWFFYQQTRFADAPITPTAESVVIASGDGMNVLRKLREPAWTRARTPSGSCWRVSSMRPAN